MSHQLLPVCFSERLSLIAISSHMSVLCSARSLSRLPCASTTFRKMIHIRWCCTDRLKPPHLSGTIAIASELPVIQA